VKIYFGNATKYQNILKLILSIALILTVVLTVSCQSEAPAPYVPKDGSPLAPTTGEPEPPTIPTQIEVFIDGSGFIPDTYNIPVGATVVWYNHDSVDHTVVARDNSFDSGRISPNETFEYTFEKSGELEYYCKIHPSMVGKITLVNQESHLTPQQVTFEQLSSNPKEFNGRDIIIDGFYFQGFEVVVLSEILEYSGYAEGHIIPEGTILWIEGGIPKEVVDRLYKQDMMGPSECYGKIKLRGIFEFGKHFGHLGQYDYQIVTSEVELLSWSPPAQQ